MAADNTDIESQTTKQKVSPEEKTENPIQVLPEGFTVLANGDNPVAEYGLVKGPFCCANICIVSSLSTDFKVIQKRPGLLNQRAVTVGIRRSSGNRKKISEFIGLEIFSKRIFIMCAFLLTDMTPTWGHSSLRRIQVGLPIMVKIS